MDGDMSHDSSKAQMSQCSSCPFTVLWQLHFASSDRESLFELTVNKDRK